VIGVFGIASVLPPLNDATVAFGLLQIVWFAWLGASSSRRSQRRVRITLRRLSMTATYS
jgi:hypothetical protein